MMWALFVACAVATLSPCSGARSPPTSSEVEDVIRHIKDTRRELHGIYGEDVDPSIFSLGVEFFDEKSRQKIVERLMGAFRQGGSFVVAFGGMSDVAGHGNLFEESYPNVFGRALGGVFAAAGIAFEARNLAMGGVPSYPNSACMGDNFGRDADVIVWDFRMVEVRDPMKGEMFVRQALMQERAPFVCFKRRNAYLKDLDYAHGAGALHVVDETEAYRRLVKLRAGKGCEIPNFKGSYLGRFPLVLADFWTSDHLLERSRP